MHLLEREAEFEVFARALEAATGGSGSVLLVHGEAGIGKTSFVQGILAGAEGRARRLIGGCDDLLSPRTLGPFRDMALGRDSPLHRVLTEGASRDAVMTALTEELAHPLQATVMVVEDAHWADEATRDVLTFIGRRISTMPAVLVVTYRDDAASTSDLRTALGGLTGTHVHRLALKALSPDALATLAIGHRVSGGQLLELTGGNPFLVNEVLTTGDGEVSRSVQEAVVARLRDLRDQDATLLRLLSVAPEGLEVSRMTEFAPDGLESISNAERLGLVHVDIDRVRFRHELLRRAVEATGTSAFRVSAHTRILATLDGSEPFRAVHHAIGAGDGAAVARYAPVAARQASRMASHRDAIVLFEQAIRHSDHRPASERARLLRWYAFELYLANRHDDAVRAANRAVAVLSHDDLPEELGKALTVLSHTSCWAVQPQVAREAAERAVETLRSIPPGEALGLAYSNLSFVTAMRGGFAEAESAAREGVRVAEELGLRRVLPYATAQLGASTFLAGDAAGERLLLHASELAQRAGAHEYVALAYTWLCMGALRNGRPDQVEPWARFGIEYSSQHQLAVGLTTLKTLLHELQLRGGDWATAEEGLSAIVRDPQATGWGHSAANSLLGRLLARRGDEGALELLGRGWRLAIQSEEVERIARAGAAWFEWAALHDDDAAYARGKQAMVVTRVVGNPWLLGELVRLEAEIDGPNDGDACIAEPWRSGARGDWEQAAAGFSALGWSFELARELASSGDPDQMVEAVRLQEALGAAKTAAVLRRKLRARGMSNLPRGPARQTRENPLGLTARQAEVLELLTEGLTNAQIAERLVVSIRTVDHHVSAVLTKLGVSSRQEAAQAARHAVVSGA
jgi:ATP/maltotriose-dependent transcriptional regulator MalT